MSLSALQQSFIASLQNIYAPQEAENIFYLVIENLTGIDLRNNKIATFTPDGCFIEMLSEIQERLQKQEPVQYILNEAWFYDIPFYVDRSVLIPRPETEELVDWTIRDHKENDAITILDIGTGSGCIPVVLKRKLASALVWSCDISKKALEVAAKNARQHQTDIHFLHLDFLDRSSWAQLPKADVLISNPPYIPHSDQVTMHKNVLAYEPHEALFVKDDHALVFYEALAAAGRSVLKPTGKIYVEVYEGLGKETALLFEQSGYFTILKKDMQGKDRMIKAKCL
ncbi:peptide chain release factor N(5)-glutamine methyltransferase [Niabella aquatica]